MGGLLGPGGGRAVRPAAAVDIGDSDATDGLSEHGATYGLCRIYRNEPWHYEPRAKAGDRGCPRMHADPTRDLRMRR